MSPSAARTWGGGARRNALLQHHLSTTKQQHPFAFIERVHRDRQQLLAQCKATLHPLGRGDEAVTQHLPTSTTTTDAMRTSSAALLRKTAVIEISNPAARNALTGKMMVELSDAIHKLEQAAARPNSQLNCVVLRGARGFFCAGADLLVAKDALSSRHGGMVMSTLLVDALTRLRRLPLVSVAAIEGGAIGGGAELATACDYRVLDQSGFVQFVQARMGVSLGTTNTTLRLA